MEKTLLEILNYHERSLQAALSKLREAKQILMVGDRSQVSLEIKVKQILNTDENLDVHCSDMIHRINIYLDKQTRIRRSMRNLVEMAIFLSSMQKGVQLPLKITAGASSKF